MATTPPSVVVFLDDHRGRYIPRDFAQVVDRTRVQGVSDEDYADLLDPESETYWDTWATVCDRAVLTGTDGVVYTLYQDGALFLIPQGMEMTDGTWEWPEEKEV